MTLQALEYTSELMVRTIKGKIRVETNIFCKETRAAMQLFNQKHRISHSKPNPDFQS